MSSAIEQSTCCQSSVYTIFTGPEILEEYKRDFDLTPPELKPFSEITVCSECRLPCNTVFSFESTPNKHKSRFELPDFGEED